MSDDIREKMIRESKNIPPRFCEECKKEMITIWDHEPGCSVPQQIVDMAKKKNEGSKT